MSKKIEWPVYNGNRLVQDGTIDGVPMSDIWKQCKKESTAYYRKKVKEWKKRGIKLGTE